jgi:hypothetical protein
MVGRFASDDVWAAEIGARIGPEFDANGNSRFGRGLPGTRYIAHDVRVPLFGRGRPGRVSTGAVLLKGGAKMWLPKDERRLMAAYYKAIAEVGKTQRFEYAHLAHVSRLGYREQNDSESSDLKRGIREGRSYLQACSQIEKANKLLVERGLIAAHRPENPVHRAEVHVVSVSLTTAGYDLGRRYSNWFDRTGLWFEHYRNHWIWLILACLGGAAMSEIIRYIMRAL